MAGVERRDFTAPDETRHSSIRVTQEIYVHVCADVYDRFFDATQ